MFKKWYDIITLAPEVEAGAAAAPSSEAPAPSETTDEGQPGGQTIAEILAFDPFSAPEPKAKEETAKVAEPKPADPKAATGKTPAQPKAAETPKPAVPDPATQAIQELTRTLANAPRPVQVQPQAPVKPAAPKFNVQLPSTVTDALYAEDASQRAQAMNTVLTSVMNNVYDTVMKHINEEVLGKQIPSMMQAQQSSASTAQRVMEDFYGSYPHWRKPELMPYIGQTAMMLAQEEGQNFRGYTADFKAKLAARMTAVFGAAQPQAPQPPPAQPAPRKPQYQSGNGARPAVETGPAADILDTLFGPR